MKFFRRFPESLVAPSNEDFGTDRKAAGKNLLQHHFLCILDLPDVLFQEPASTIIINVPLDKSAVMERFPARSPREAPSGSSSANTASDPITESKTQGAKSLQDLSVDKIFDELSREENPAATILDLHDVPQALVIGHLWKSHVKLQKLEKRARTGIDTYAPNADCDLWSQRWDRIDEETQDEMNSVVSEWKYHDAWANPVTQSTIQTSWDGGCLKRDLSTGILGLCINEHGSPRRHCVSTCTDHEEAPIFGVISSQLLLYRLSAVFGLPFHNRMGPGDMDKSVYEADLLHDNNESLLTIQDYKGAANINFMGTADGSRAALELINWLMGMDIAGPYGGTLAGTTA